MYNFVYIRIYSQLYVLQFYLPLLGVQRIDPNKEIKATLENKKTKQI